MWWNYLQSHPFPVSCTFYTIAILRIFVIWRIFIYLSPSFYCTLVIIVEYSNRNSLMQLETNCIGLREQSPPLRPCWFWLWALHRHQYVILHWPAEFYACWIIADGVMASDWFYQMAAIALQIYFRFPIWPSLTFWKIQSYRHMNFRPDISIYG